MMSLRPMARSVPPFTPLSTFLRSNSSASSSTPTPIRPPPRAPVVPTTFSEKASPKNVHQRPEQIRGFPPMTKKPEWETARSTASSSNADPEAFNGPSRPRLMYERPRRRELPEIKVSTASLPRVSTDGAFCRIACQSVCPPRYSAGLC